MADPSIDNAQRFLDDAVRLATSNTALSGGAGRMALTAPGRYHLTFTKASRFKQGDSTVTVTSSTGTFAPVDNTIVADVEVSGDADRYFDVITTESGATGFVEASRVR
jgi:hypothetical protein